MCTILLIDAHEDSRRIYRTFLQHHGYRTLEANDPSAGRRLAHECAPALIVLSAFLPRIDAGVLREWPRRSSATPVVLLTAHPLAEQECALLRGLYDAHLTKPCPPTTLLAAVERLLPRRIEA